MSRERGTTLVEALVAGSLVLAVAAAWAGVWFTGRKTDASSERRQEYARLLARLDDRVRRDLRSSVSLRQDGPGRWTLLVLGDVPGGDRPLEREVAWRCPSLGTRVERQEALAVETFEFGPYLDGKPFVFKIGSGMP